MSTKLRSTNPEQLEDLEMDMSPMIDMVFLLLIFFIVASKIITHHIDPEVQIPLGDKAEVPKVKGARIIINVYEDNDPAPFASEYGRSSGKGDKFQDVEALTNYLRDKKRYLNEIEGHDKEKIGIIIRGHRKAQIGMVKRAVQAAANVGITEVTFAAYQSAPSGY